MIGLSLALAAAIAVQDPPQQSLSAGEVLLLSNAKDPAQTSDALRAALLSPDVGTRLAAARVIATVPHGELHGALVGALAREQTAFAGAEMIRDLLILSGGVDVDTVESQVRRLGDAAAVSLAEWLARERPDQFLARQADFLALPPSRRAQLLALASVAAAQHPADAERIRAAWTAGTATPSRASTLPSLGPGVVASTLSAAKCALDHGKVVTADLTYGNNGRPVRVSMDPTGLSSGCVAAWTALARTTVARWQQPALPNTVETVMLPLSSDFVPCIDARNDDE